MSKFPVSPEKERELLERMRVLGIHEQDIDETFIRGSGSGGQKINKTSSCVQLLHQPTGIIIKCQKTRSQALNRFHARRELCDKIERKEQAGIQKEDAERSKIRRQKARRSRRTKQKMVEQKRKHSETKRGRGRVKNSAEE